MTTSEAAYVIEHRHEYSDADFKYALETLDAAGWEY